jgi:micrococcal nuclease
VALAVAVVVALVGCADGDPAGDGRDPSRGGGAAVDESDEGDEGATTPTAPRDLDGRAVTVTSITDGDTLRAGEERVRLIGIDAPEVDGAECGADAATDALERLVPVGTRVLLVADEDPTDRYDRTLAYVHRASDGLHVNQALARRGYATPIVVAPNDAHAGEIEAAARAAVADGRGLWGGACPVPLELTGSGPPATTTRPASTVATPPAPPATDAPPPTGAGRPGCDPSYPTVCIPPSPPDLDCADVPHRRFAVLPPDPHRFDGGGDGLGCER